MYSRCYAAVFICAVECSNLMQLMFRKMVVCSLQVARIAFVCYEIFYVNGQVITSILVFAASQLSL